MDIRPSDLGEGFAQEIIIDRGKGLSNPLYAFHYRLFHRRQTQLSQTTIQNILPALAASNRHWLIGMVGGMLAGYAIGMAICTYLLGFDLKDLRTFSLLTAAWLIGSVLAKLLTLSFSDIRPLQKAFTAPLTAEQTARFIRRSDKAQAASVAYANLVHDLLREPAIALAAQSPLRDALRSLGEAVFKLTRARIPFRSWENLAEKQQLATWKAGIESDPVVKAALLREAESYQQAIQSAKHNVVLRQRNEALLNELTAQIEALRIGLPAFYATSAVDSYQLSRLGENARAVAAEAMAQYHARAELDTETKRVPVGTFR